MASRNPPWAEEELILALDLYLRSGLLHDAHQDVIDLSNRLRTLAVHSAPPDPDRFRNPNGVAMKLANFAAIDPNFSGRGLTRAGRRDAAVWDRYASDEDALTAIATAIGKGQTLPSVQPTKPRRTGVTRTNVETQHVKQFQVSVPGQTIDAFRREQGLVLAYADYLEQQGHQVMRHTYRVYSSPSPLACDLVDETDDMLYEAKGDVRRTSIRMAIGQLLDYRRLESKPMRIAVLLPRQPAQDLVDLIGSVPASTVWRTKCGFTSVNPSGVGLETH